MKMGSEGDSVKTIANKSDQYLTRPNASPGYWICSLLPLAYLVNSFRHPKSSAAFEYRLTTIGAVGLCLQSILIFVSIDRHFSKLKRVCLAQAGAIVIAFAIVIIMSQTLSVSLFWGSMTTLIFLIVYYKLLTVLPNAFTLGEASITAQGLVLFLLNAALQIPKFVMNSPTSRASEMHAIMITALFCLTVTLIMLYFVKFLRMPIFFYPLMVILVLFVCVVPVTRDLPIVTLWNFIISDLRRIFIMIFYLGIVGASIGAVSWRMKYTEKATTGTRKIFHLMVVMVYIPGLIYQCSLLYISTGVALALMTVLETFRVLRIPPIYETLESAFNIFADEKDCGRLALTPFYLIVGCSMPLWISPSTCTIIDNAMQNLVSMLSGVLTVGIGDTMASVIGSTLGKHKLPGSNKSIEGTVASILSQALAIYFLGYYEFIIFTPNLIFTASLAVVVASVIEALTNQIDNLVLPLVFYILCAKS